MRARVVCLVLMSCLGSQACQDQAGLGQGSPGGFDEHEGPNDTTEASRAAANVSTPASPGEGTHPTPTSTTDPHPTSESRDEDPEGRMEEGEWSEVERFTIVPSDDRFDEVDPWDVEFCSISRYAKSILIVRVVGEGDYYRRCIGENLSQYNATYIEHRFKRLRHLAGARLPLEFDVINFVGERLFEVGKTYLVGLREVDGQIFSNNNGVEVILHDEARESDLVQFSGKATSLASMGEAHIEDRERFCSPSSHIPADDDEAYRRVFLERKEGLCVNN